MKKNEVVVGKTYEMNHTSGRIQVRILEEVNKLTHYGAYFGSSPRKNTYWKALNLKTNREIVIKSAVNLKEIS